MVSENAKVKKACFFKSVIMKIIPEITLVGEKTGTMNL
jgi:hypothetical protein